MIGIDPAIDDTIATLIETINEKLNKTCFYNDRMITFDKSTAFLTKNQRFQRAFDMCALNDEDRSRAWRMHTLAWAADIAMQLDGDFVECGVFEGFMSQTIIEYVGFAETPRTFYLYDTFDGFSPKYSEPDDFGTGSGFYDFANKVYGRDGLYEDVVDRFAPYPNAKVIRGVVPDVLHDNSPETIAFLHIDMNSPRAEQGALEVLFDRVVPGGVIVFDDYGWLSYAKQMEAADAFMNARGYFVLELPTGQGLTVKR
jgi:hypothetical protein